MSRVPGKTIADSAEIMKPTQPSKFVNTTHQEMFFGCHAQWA
jgi:hypothetical protein